MKLTKTKAEANYRESTSKDRRCANCSMFVPKEHKCTLVRGEIKPEDVCSYWERKKYANGGS